MKIVKYFAFLIATFEMNSLYASSLAQKKGLLKPHVKSAKILLDEGSVIYGNALMQSKLRIQYELFEGFKLNNIELREFKTNEIIEGDYAVKNPNGRGVSGWSVSDIDSGYDHNIIQNGREPLVVFKKAGSTPVYKYISSINRKSWIKICFVLTTSAEDSDNSSDIVTFSTCDDDGIMNGSVTIFSEAPKKLRATDFILKKYASLDEDRADLYVINPGLGIARGMSFKALDTLNATVIIPSYQNAIMYRSYKTKVDDHDDVIDDKKTVFAISYLLKTKEKDDFSYLSLSKYYVTGYSTVVINTKNLKSATAVILNYKHNNNRTVYNSSLCDLEKISTESKNVYCYKMSLIYNPVRCLYSAKELTKVLDDLKKEVAVIRIIDNYGTVHKITLSYGVGDENYDLFIN